MTPRVHRLHLSLSLDGCTWQADNRGRLSRLEFAGVGMRDKGKRWRVQGLRLSGGTYVGMQWRTLVGGKPTVDGGLEGLQGM